MFPLAGPKLPTSADALAAALAGALGDVFSLPNKRATVSIAGGGQFPEIDSLRIDLDGATVNADKPPPKPVGTGKREPGPRVGKLDLSGQPIRYGQSKLNLKVTARGLKFDFDRDTKGNALLVLTDASGGEVDARISKQDIQTVLTEVATVAAKQQGITVQDVELTLESAGPRSIAADVRVKAKKMMMSGVIHVTGKLDIDDELNATLSDLTCTGEGIVGVAAAGFLQSRIKPYNGTTIPLMAFSLGDVALRDLKIDLKKDLKVTANFGTA